jgi:hypothetical protein
MSTPTPRPSARRRFSTVALAVALLLGGGAALSVAALSGGTAGADTTLGGFTVSALAEASTAQYEQPNFPLPATPSLEFDEGYASTSDNFGPSGSAVASALYPGQVVANAGPELSLLVPGLPLPAAPVWPVQAVSSYPETPNTDSTDQPGANMDATSTGDANTATATIGSDAPAAGSGGTTTSTTAPAVTIPDVTSLTGALTSLLGGSTGTTGNGNPLAATSSLMGIGFSSGTSTSGATGGNATATATATDSGISILGGLINIGGVTSTATATSDGTTGTVTGSTVLTNVTVAGEAVTIDGSGIHAAGSSTPAVPISSLNTLLSQLGISFSLTNPVDTLKGASASRTLDGLTISFDLTTLDAAADTLSATLPASVTSQLPVAVPDKQIFTLDLGAVTVSSAAAPGFDSSSGSTGSSDDSSLGSLASGNFGDGGSGLGDTGTGGDSSVGGTATTAHTGIGRPASAITPIFSGIGAGLILLGLLASGAMAYAYKRVDDATEMVGPLCADGDPLGARFSDGPDSILDDTGGFGS